MIRAAQPNSPPHHAPTNSLEMSDRRNEPTYESYMEGQKPAPQQPRQPAGHTLMPELDVATVEREGLEAHHGHPHAASQGMKVQPGGRKRAAGALNSFIRLVSLTCHPLQKAPSTRRPPRSRDPDRPPQPRDSLARPSRRKGPPQRDRATCSRAPIRPGSWVARICSSFCPQTVE